MTRIELIKKGFNKWGLKKFYSILQSMGSFPTCFNKLLV